MSAEGHNQLCYYCGKPCNSLHGNPDLWAVALCHSNEPGIVKWHHIGCVSKRLHELESLRQENSRLRERMNQLTDDYEGTIKRLREALATWLKWWDHEISATDKGRIYNWTVELLNPPKNR